MSEEMVNGGEILLYQNGAEKEVVNVVFHDENFWLTQKGMAELFGVKVPAISKHLKNIFLVRLRSISLTTIFNSIQSTVLRLVKKSVLATELILFFNQHSLNFQRFFLKKTLLSI